MTSKTQKSINVIASRIYRKSTAKGIWLDQSNVYVAAWSIYSSRCYAVGSSNNYNGPSFERVTLAQLVKDSRYTFRDLFDQTKPSTVGGYYDYSGYEDRKWIPEEDVYLIPYVAYGHYVDDFVLLANYKAIKEQFADLFDARILTEENGNVYVYHNRPYWDENRMQELLDTLEGLHNYPLIDENLWSELENEAQNEFIASEVNWFVTKLDVHEDLQFLFDTDLITDDTLISHIWQLINDNNMEFENAWIDIDKLAKLSPLYRLGYNASDSILFNVSEIFNKVVTTCTTQPANTILDRITEDLDRLIKGQPVIDSLSY